MPNLVTVGLSAAGTFEAENLNGSADVIVDVEGYYGPGSAGTGLYNALSTPARICDTRAGNPSGLAGRPSVSVRATLLPRATPSPWASTGWVGCLRRASVQSC